MATISSSEQQPLNGTNSARLRKQHLGLPLTGTTAMTPGPAVFDSSDLTSSSSSSSLSSSNAQGDGLTPSASSSSTKRSHGRRRSSSAAKSSSSSSRKNKTHHPPPHGFGAKKGSKAAADSEDETSVTMLDIVRLVVGLVLLSTVLSYFVTSGTSFVWGVKRPWWAKPAQLQAYINGPIALTPDQLSQYNGTDPTLPIYISLNSTIYDVSASPHIYGPGGMYGFFSGRDATRAFVTGCFREDITADVRGVEDMFLPLYVDDDGKPVPDDEIVFSEKALQDAHAKVHKAIAGWQRFFENSPKYFRVGWLVLEDGWLEKLPRRPLCEAAQRDRPTRKRGGAAKGKGKGKGQG
ncbi:MAG: hypothetical protein M1819_006239 [Sarea resinae]|nr:MAG: hypothetical protein M1819_006239 [Sarea resinae]